MYFKIKKKIKIKTTIIRIPPLVSEPELTVWFVENVFLFLISFIMYPPPSLSLGAAKKYFFSYGDRLFLS